MTPNKFATLSLCLSFKLLQAHTVYANDGNPLEKDQWQYRPLVVVANKNIETKNIAALNALEKPEVQRLFNERHMVLYTVIDNAGKRNGHLLTPTSVSALLASLKIEKASEKRTIILLGKDGEEKLNTDENISIESIFNLIDGRQCAFARLRKNKSKK